MLSYRYRWVFDASLIGYLQSCMMELHIHVVRPCMIPSLSIGNIKEQSLSELTKKYKDNLFFSKILTKGVRGIANDIRERQLFEIADYYVDACDFCRDIFNDNYKTSILEKFYRTEKNVMN